MHTQTYFSLMYLPRDGRVCCTGTDGQGRRDGCLTSGVTRSATGKQSSFLSRSHQDGFRDGPKGSRMASACEIHVVNKGEREEDNQQSFPLLRLHDVK